MTEWTKTVAPKIVASCECDAGVESKSDGLVEMYRCADCHTHLGDTTMGHEP